MAQASRKQELLARAKKAEEEAAEAKSAEMRDGWLGVAQTYRDLAGTA